MMTLVSGLAPQLESFVRQRVARGCWCEGYDDRLRRFDRHCAGVDPGATTLTQEMVDGWFEKRDTETPESSVQKVGVWPLPPPMQAVRKVSFRPDREKNRFECLYLAMIDILPDRRGRVTENGRNAAKTGGIPETWDALPRPGGNLGDIRRFRGTKRKK